METSKLEQNYFVLVRGGGHGAWLGFKLKSLLEAAGHKATTFDLAASGINTKEIYHDVRTYRQYNEPLMDIMASIPDDEKVILVGHGLGGVTMAFAMEEFPRKISVAVFVSAVMPDTKHRPSYVLEQHLERHPTEDWMDTVFTTHGDNFTSFLLGPDFLTFKLYQLSPIEDLELAKSLVRPASFFIEDLAQTEKFSNDKFGSVKKVFVVLKQDLTISEEFKRWIIKNGDVKDVMEINGANHIVMISAPQELCNTLLQIAQTYN